MHYSAAENLILVFHSYPSKPCVDGLMSIILVTQRNKIKQNIILVPYWRTKASYLRVKEAVESVGVNNTSIMYVDCAPDLEDEVNYLQSVKPDLVSIDVYDNHVEKTSPMHRLRDDENKFHVLIDAKQCAAKSLYNNLLNVAEREEFKKYHGVLTLVHFSDYEGMDPASSGKPESSKIALTAFDKAIKINAGSICEKNLRTIKERDMCLYYILDDIMAKKEDWAFFYNDDLSDDEIYKIFLEQNNKYLEDAVSAVLGESKSLYKEDKTRAYIQLCEEMESKLKKGRVIKDKKINEKNVDIFVCNIDIFIYGRTLEPYVQNEMKHRGAAYAILMNNPTVNNEGQQMYYFSLRRTNTDTTNDAKHLATYVMNISGSKIGGGHSWASGVTLNHEQYRKFIEMESLNSL